MIILGYREEGCRLGLEDIFPGRMKEGEFDFVVSFLSLLQLMHSSCCCCCRPRHRQQLLRRAEMTAAMIVSGYREEDFSGSRHRGYWGHVSGGGLERDAMVDVCGA